MLLLVRILVYPFLLMLVVIGLLATCSMYVLVEISVVRYTILHCFYLHKKYADETKSISAWVWFDYAHLFEYSLLISDQYIIERLFIYIYGKRCVQCWKKLIGTFTFLLMDCNKIWSVECLCRLIVALINEKRKRLDEFAWKKL